MKNKTIILISVFTISLLLTTTIEDVNASNYTVTKSNPDTNCEFATTTPLENKETNFESIENVNLSDAVKKYCSISCKETATTKYSGKIGNQNSGMNNIILGGTHFKWDDNSILIKKTCTSNIDYNKWAADYNALIKEYEFSALRIIIENYMNKSQGTCNKPKDIKGYSPDGRYSSKGETYTDTDSCYCKSISSQNGGAKFLKSYVAVKDADIIKKLKCNEGNIKCKKILTFKAPDVLHSGHCEEIPGAAGCAQQPGGSMLDCPNNFYMVSADHEEYTQEGINKVSVGGQVCVKGLVSVYKYTNKWKIIKQVWNTKYSPLDLKTSNLLYCSGDPEPTMDTSGELRRGEEAEKLSVLQDSWQQIFNQINQQMKNMRSILKTCNQAMDDDALFGNQASPIIKVFYKNPENNPKYNLDGLELDIKNIKSSKTSTTPQGADLTYSAPAIKNMDCGGAISRSSSESAAKSFIENVRNNQSYFEKQCNVRYDLEGYKKTNVTTTKTYTYNYEMPKNTYRYVMKINGLSVSKVDNNTDYPNNYVDLGYPNYPVHSETLSGTYPIYFLYSRLGTNGRFTGGVNGTRRYDCTYKVINKILPCIGADCDNPDCKGDRCDRCYGDKCPGNNGLNGLNVIYRPISLSNPFPGEKGRGRTAGDNWNIDNNIADYITNNRGVREDDVYKQMPIYSFTLSPQSLKQIRSYNKSRDSSTGRTRDYNDFNLKCSHDKNGKRCMSSFLRGITNYGVVVNPSTCYGKSDGNFYSCRASNLPTQDNVKCALNAAKKLECYNCAKTVNKNNAVCKGSGN